MLLMHHLFFALTIVIVIRWNGAGNTFEFLMQVLKVRWWTVVVGCNVTVRRSHTRNLNYLCATTATCDIRGRCVGDDIWRMGFSLIRE
uniref:Putative secreted peptide n=1 Tax=Anopheles braziliensis TaxID=58242 RepID=A0A2M3ZNW2_9DIPT